MKLVWVFILVSLIASCQSGENEPKKEDDINSLREIVEELKLVLHEQRREIHNLNLKVELLERKLQVRAFYNDWAYVQQTCWFPKKGDTVEERLEHLEEVAKVKVLRSCDELAKHGITKSGDYDIDPDGDMIGNPPIKVFCDFVTGETLIHHDSEVVSFSISWPNQS